MVPKQVGQSGQAREDSVAWTTLPRKRRRRVQITVMRKALGCWCVFMVRIYPSRGAECPGSVGSAETFRRTVECFRNFL
jgi:hypothetical protein